MKKSIEELYKQQDIITQKIIKIQEKCKHLNNEKKYGANTGNYDPSSDCYWKDFRCLDCNKRWRVE